MSRWFRHYAGMMRDDKLVRAALKSGQTVERVVWVWGAILESAAEIDEDGRFDLDPAEAAYFLRADEADIRRILDCLAELGRIRENVVAKWSDRQFKSDRSAERVRAHRERRNAGRDRGDGQCDPVSEDDRNGDVTSVKRYGNSPETDTEKDSSVSSLRSDTGAVPAPDLEDDPKKILFDAPLRWLAKTTGKPEGTTRTLLGRWLKLTGDDAEAITSLIRQAKHEQAADPVPWIEARLKPKAQGPPWNKPKIDIDEIGRHLARMDRHATQ